MANGNVKIDSDPAVLFHIADSLGEMQPDTYKAAFKSIIPDLIKPPAPAPMISGLSAPLTLNRFQSMNLNPERQQSPLGAGPQALPLQNTSAPAMARPVLGRIPPEAPPATEIKKPSLLHRAGSVLGKIGEVAGSALIPNVMPWIPGTEQEKLREERQNQERTQFGTEQEKEKAGIGETGALTKQHQAEAERAQAETKRSQDEAAGLERKTKDIQDYMAANPGATQLEAERAIEAALRPPPEAVQTVTDPQGRVFTLGRDAKGNPTITPLASPSDSAAGGAGAAPQFTEMPKDKERTPYSANQISQLNQGLQGRWNVLNKGAIPANFQLPANATREDFANIDKLLSQEESAAATAAQREQTKQLRDATLAIAQQGLDLRKEAEGERKEKQESTWVTWNENGRDVAGPISMAKSAGATDFATLPAQEVRDVQNARHAVRLMTKTGDPKKPETNGVLQLIDSLDNDGKLGVLASRWNKVMTTGAGTEPDDDPRIVTLIDKNMLADTAAMLAHFGASGGRSPQMLKHFTDMADAGKMDAETLRAGTKAIADYMAERSMRPSGGAGESTGGGGAQVGTDEHVKQWLQNRKKGKP